MPVKSWCLKPWDFTPALWCTKYNLPLALKASGLKPSVCFKTCSSFCAENYENIEKVLAPFNVLYDKIKQVTPKLYTLCGCSFFTPLSTYIRCLSSVTGIRMSEKVKRRITRFYNREAYLETGQQQLRKPICLRQIKANWLAQFWKIKFRNNFTPSRKQLKPFHKTLKPVFVVQVCHLQDTEEAERPPSKKNPP